MTEELGELLAVRRRKLEDLQKAGVHPFGERFDTDGNAAEIRAQFEEGKSVRMAGRLTAHRNMGKSQFLDLSDFSGRFQVYLSTKNLSDMEKQVFDAVDLGDFLGVEGEYFTTKTGELSIRAHRFQLLSKALQPLPDKWHGIHDIEKRYRQRYLDLIANEASREIFAKRIRIVREIRRFLEDRGFLEVETPMMQPVAGGAAAEPFRTHHHALHRDLYLRIAPELYLKRLLVAGFQKIFELNRNFRNEGISRRHNPEFTMVEAYWAYADFEKMAGLVEDLICHLAETVCGGLEIPHRNAKGEIIRIISLKRPWRRAHYKDLVEEVEPGWFAKTADQRKERAKEMGLDISHCEEDFEITQRLFEKRVEEKTMDPCFVTRCPRELVPLACRNREDDSVVDVFELIINGQEISPGYSELNDPLEQRHRLEVQSGGETQKMDEDFLLALEHGMPPAGGIGIGIDRLVMMLTGAESIRDVILFPHLRPRVESNLPDL